MRFIKPYRLIRAQQLLAYAKADLWPDYDCLLTVVQMVKKTKITIAAFQRLYLWYLALPRRVLGHGGDANDPQEEECVEPTTAEHCRVP